ncbi:hypothetical protein LXL04_008584 [Taraxacum kok-saghyz]
MAFTQSPQSLDGGSTASLSFQPLVELYYKGRIHMHLFQRSRGNEVAMVVKLVEELKGNCLEEMIRCQMLILGVMVNRYWVMAHDRIKREFLKPSPSRVSLMSIILTQVSREQLSNVESMVTLEAIQRKVPPACSSVVLDYGASKGSRFDGFTFEFFKSFDILWNMIWCRLLWSSLLLLYFLEGVTLDLLIIVLRFLMRGAKLAANLNVGKVLNNTLAVSTFIAGHQILDGLMILNEEVLWCKATQKRGVLILRRPTIKFNETFLMMFCLVFWKEAEGIDTRLTLFVYGIDVSELDRDTEISILLEV